MSRTNPRLDSYQANTRSNSLREGVEDIDCWVQPPCQPVISGLRLIEVVDLLLKYSENGGRRIAGLELSCERMREKVLLCLLFVHFQGIVEN